jgi:acetylornithine deacetylase or succinyl-diaminopimelate desuccinylase
MNAALKTALDRMTTSEAERLASRLIEIPSYAGAPGAESGVASFIADYARSLGIESRIEEAESGRPNVLCTIPGTGSGRKLLLVGHIDTVPPYAMSEPFAPRVIDGKLYGRGAVDMKASVACMLLALRSIKESGLRLPGDIIFAGVCDEEERSAGARALLRSAEGEPLADGAIIGEPTAMRLCLGHRGLEWFELSIQGKTVHGGSQEQGLSAISAAADLVRRIDLELRPRLAERRHPLLGSATINVGRIAGGTQPSTVAGDCSLSIDRRWLPSETYESTRDELAALLKEIEAAMPGIKTSLRVMDESYMEEAIVHAPLETSSNEAIASSCLAAITAEELLAPSCAELGSFPAWSDAGLIATYGHTPSVVWGPGDLASAHSSEEHIALSQLVPAIRCYALAAYDFCS